MAQSEDVKSSPSDDRAAGRERWPASWPTRVQPRRFPADFADDMAAAARPVGPNEVAVGASLHVRRREGAAGSPLERNIRAADSLVGVMDLVAAAEWSEAAAEVAAAVYRAAYLSTRSSTFGAHSALAQLAYVPRR